MRWKLFFVEDWCHWNSQKFSSSNHAQIHKLVECHNFFLSAKCFWKYLCDYYRKLWVANRNLLKTNEIPAKFQNQSELQLPIHKWKNDHNIGGIQETWLNLFQLLQMSHSYHNRSLLHWDKNFITTLQSTWHAIHIATWIDYLLLVLVCRMHVGVCMQLNHHQQ